MGRSGAAEDHPDGLVVFGGVVSSRSSSAGMGSSQARTSAPRRSPGTLDEELGGPETGGGGASEGFRIAGLDLATGAEHERPAPADRVERGPVDVVEQGPGLLESSGRERGIRRARRRRERAALSGVRSAARPNAAAVATNPPRSRARPAEHPNWAATASSGPAKAAARCQVRRSNPCRKPWRRPGPGGPGAVRTGGAPVDRGANQGVAELDSDPLETIRMRSAGVPAPGSRPEVVAAAVMPARSPVGSAAASRSQAWVWSGSPRTWVR